MRTSNPSTASTVGGAPSIEYAGALSFGTVDSADRLEELVSGPRFATYVSLAGGDRDRAVELYHRTGDVAGGLMADFRRSKCCSGTASTRPCPNASQTRLGRGSGSRNLRGSRPGTIWTVKQSALWTGHVKLFKSERQQALRSAGERSLLHSASGFGNAQLTPVTRNHFGSVRRCSRLVWP